MEKLEQIAEAMAKTAKEAGVRIVSGDTKVAGKGQVDGVFITTTGMGQIEDGVQVGGELAKPGDAVIVTGDIGRHGCTILLARRFRNRGRCEERLRPTLEDGGRLLWTRHMNFM